MNRVLRSLLILVSSSAALAGCWWSVRHMPARWWRDDIVAEVHGAPVTLADVQEGLRIHLWRRGQNWDAMTAENQDTARREVMQGLIDERLVRHYRARQPAIDVQAATTREVESWWKQFETEPERNMRLGWQHLTEQKVADLVSEIQADQAWLEKQAEGRMTSITLRDLRDWYAAHAETLRIPAAYRASHIYLSRHEPTKPNREPEIQAIHQKLLASQGTLAELAAQVSEDERSKKLGGDLGWFTRDHMPADFMTAVEHLEIGQVSAPVLTALGWHIIQLSERQPSRPPTFEEARDEIAALLQSRSRSEAANAVMAALRRRSESDGSSWYHNTTMLGKAIPTKIHGN
ncbi:MAG: peptidylprolyl isomerase [Prosthecobacter sp.]|nr:peptidylprolyl isomerase [Prosthecobacter sp.]